MKRVKMRYLLIRGRAMNTGILHGSESNLPQASFWGIRMTSSIMPRAMGIVMGSRVRQ